MAALAGCGLIYEYLLSHYAARVLGAVESTIFTMIGLMIVSMGFGSFAAKKIQDAHTAFAWLEICIAFLGLGAIFIIALAFSFANLLPAIIAETYRLSPDLQPEGGVAKSIYDFVSLFPYIIGTLLGFLIGMEIPLIARIRQHNHDKQLLHNTGTIYGADYIGAGIGAAIWVIFMLNMPITAAAATTASINVIAGLSFYFRYQKHIRYPNLYFFSQLLLIALTFAVFAYGSQWSNQLENTLYKDSVIFSKQTKYQRFTITKRIMDPAQDAVFTFFINGRTQFSSSDEIIYHEMLVHPAMLASANHDNILIIGGGDGLALREVLKWNPKKVTLIDLDEEIVTFFSKPYYDSKSEKFINTPLIKLNKNAFSDPRVNLVYGDAFIEIDQLLKNEILFNSIIVDLPDPNHPDLNKLYSKRFYEKLSHLLSGDGAIVVQSTSPYHAKNAFLSIGKTVKAAGFLHVNQYHQNVPSFGEWGWTIATRNGLPPITRLKNSNTIPIKTNWLTLEISLAAFHFPQNYFATLNSIQVNRLGSHQLYQYHQTAWEKQQGIYQIEP